MQRRCCKDELAARAPLDLRRSPSVSASESLIYECIRCIACVETNYQLFTDTLIARDLLIPRVGKSAALDASLSCITKAMESMRRGKTHAEWIDANLYCHTIDYLRKAIDDPVERYSTETLLATLVLSKLEDCFGTPDRLNFITHAGGMAGILRYRGPRSLDDASLHLVLHSCQGATFSYALTKHQDSVFCQPDWQDIFDDCETIHTGPENFMNRLHRHLAYWPTFAKEIGAFGRGEGVADDLTMRLEATMSVMEEMEIELTMHLRTESWAIEVETDSPTRLTSTSYRFWDMTAAGACSYHAMYCIVLNTMLAGIDTSPARRAYLAGRNFFYSRRIWMCNEYAQSLRPLSCGFFATPLIITYKLADDSMAVKILQALDSLAAHKGCRRRIFSDATVFGK